MRKGKREEREGGVRIGGDRRGWTRREGGGCEWGSRGE